MDWFDFDALFLTSYDVEELFLDNDTWKPQTKLMLSVFRNNTCIKLKSSQVQHYVLWFNCLAQTVYFTCRLLYFFYTATLLLSFDLTLVHAKLLTQSHLTCDPLSSLSSHRLSNYYLLYQQHTRTLVVIMHQPLKAVVGYATALQRGSVCS